jgi:lysophospholipase L1-like esterase
MPIGPIGEFGGNYGGPPTSSFGGPAYNMTPQNYPNWRKAVANSIANAAASKVIFVGTSISSGGPGLGGAASTEAVPARFSALCNSRLCPSQLSFMAFQSGLVSNSDVRWTFGSGWSIGGTSGLGWGNWGRAALTAAGAASTYTPNNGSVDTFDVWWLGSNLTGTVACKIDGGSTQNVVTNTGSGTVSVGHGSATATAGSSHALALTPPGSFPASLIGIDAYLSTQLGLRVGNTGIPGVGTSANWDTTGAGQAIACIEAYAPALTVIELGADDTELGSPPSASQFITNVSGVVTAAQASGDVMFWTDPLPSTSSGYDVNQAIYNQAILTYASANNIGVVDIGTRFGLYTVWNANGFAYDNIHPNQLGYADIAGALYNALASVV